MDFGLVSKLVRSNSATAASNNGGSLASETDLRLYGSAFLNRDSRAVEDELLPAKAARISPCGGAMARVYLQECNNGGVSTHRNASIAAFPLVRSSSGPFTPSQWMELEHQALIYKYITANVPIPSYLLTPIRRALHSSSGILSCFSLQTPNPHAVGWLGFSKADPEPGRCRRTDGKKWRCSRDAVADHKYCERHMNRGRHRSRKHVEPQPKPLLPAKTTIDRCLIAAYSELGSDSLLNPIAPVSSRNRGDHEDETKSEHPLRHFIDEWPKNQLGMSRESEATQMGLCVGTVVPLEQIQRQNSWVPISWEPSVGGPLGEALHRTSECKSSKDNSSTLGVLRGAFGSLTSSIGPGAESSNGLIAPGLMLPSLPAL